MKNTGSVQRFRTLARFTREEAARSRRSLAGATLVVRPQRYALRLNRRVISSQLAVESVGLRTDQFERPHSPTRFGRSVIGWTSIGSSFASSASSAAFALAGVEK